jgi:hypothetical protein
MRFLGIACYKVRCTIATPEIADPETPSLIPARQLLEESTPAIAAQVLPWLLSSLV